MIPTHVAIVMDGNGRWAKQRLLPRVMGHRAGVKSVRRAIDFCGAEGIKILSLFTLSIENFLYRPVTEVEFLLSLLIDMFTKNIDELHEKNVCIRVAGDISVFSQEIQHQIQRAITRTQHNDGLILVLALNYSGRWDIMQAAKKFAEAVLEKKYTLPDCEEKDFSQFLCLNDLPEPDLFIRTSGEQRISNFFLWQLAYTELFFTEIFWPDFDEKIFAEAIVAFQKRERRFGLTGEQVAKNK
ncbi:MAG: polyprenyl diphosphate synthase [Coxiellaceae bacterium]|nr:polyprenyl diphosphate synthase [Coxiellaceae bacterium]